MKTLRAAALFTLLLAAATASAQPPDLTGKWSGRWESAKNGHTGPLHARFTKLSDEQYRVRFRGRFAVVIPFCYSMKMNVVGVECDRLVLGGSHRLGPVFGTFHYSGTATHTHFDATFSATSDIGKFVLTRAGVR
jgi:hypothetical protein